MELFAPIVSDQGHFLAACAIISDAKFDHLCKVVMSARSCHCNGNLQNVTMRLGISCSLIDFCPVVWASVDDPCLNQLQTGGSKVSIVFKSAKSLRAPSFCIMLLGEVLSWHCF